MSAILHNLTIGIDKISVVYDDPGGKPAIDSSIREILTKANLAFTGARLARSNSYKAFAVIPAWPDGAGPASNIVVQAGPRFDSASYRIEFNPAKIGPAGLKYLDLILTSMLGVSASPFLRDGKVTRLDLAVDIAGLTVNDVIAKTRSQRKFGVYSDQKGRPATIYLGGPRSNRLVVYDKTVANSQAPNLRVERRIHPNCSGRDLPSLIDPFAKLSVVRTAMITDLVTPYPADLFLDHARVRGIGRAMLVLPAKQQKLLKAKLTEPGVTIVGDDIWKEWPASLAASGLWSYLVPPVIAIGNHPPSSVLLQTDEPSEDAA